MDWLRCDMVTLGRTVYLTPAYLLSINFLSEILQLAGILIRPRCDNIKGTLKDSEIAARSGLWATVYKFIVS